MAEQQTDGGIPVKIPDVYPYPDGVAVAVPMTPESSGSGSAPKKRAPRKSTTKKTATGQQAITKEN